LSADLDTGPKDDMPGRQTLVLFFDICSSSRIVEDLHRTGQAKAYRDFLITIKNFLRRKENAGLCEIYKFVGDGWVLLFPQTITGNQFLKFLTELAEKFRDELNKSIIPVLGNIPEVLGLTFGADAGLLFQVTMNGNKEYIGPPLNIASRLQGAVKEDKDPAYNPANKIIISKPAFNALRVPAVYRPEHIKRKLRNIIFGQDFECVRLVIPTKP
jgi:class 3 adenylate cyclase